MKKYVFALAAFAAMPAQAAVVALNVGDPWISVDEVVGVGSFLTDSYQASTNLTLRFTDLFVVGDRYAVYKNNVFQFDSSAYDLNAAYNGDPQTSFDSGLFSRGTLGLALGDIVSFKILEIPQGYSDSTIAVSAVGTVPEPAAWAMMLAGFGLVGGAMRRRSTGALQTA